MFDRIDHMAFGPGRPLPERIAIALLRRIAADHAGGYREGFTRAEALTALAAVSTDPDLLAAAAAAHAMGDNWYAITAVGLLIEAGADPALIDNHVADYPPVPSPGPGGGFSPAGGSLS
jgi:hypothetical protein